MPVSTKVRIYNNLFAYYSCDKHFHRYVIKTKNKTNSINDSISLFVPVSTNNKNWVHALLILNYMKLKQKASTKSNSF